MTKRSTVTARETPVKRVNTASAGGLVIRSESLDVPTHDRVELVDLTDRLMAYVRPLGIKEGMLTVWSMHTTCAIFINEVQPALDTDIKRFLEERSPRIATISTTIPITPIAIGRTPIRTCGRCCSDTRWRCRSATGNWCSASGSAC
jgi:hypothetical protein